MPIEQAFALKIVSHKRKCALFLFFSFLVTALGHFQEYPFLGILSSLCGYSVFWKGITGIERAQTRFLISALWFSFLQAIYLFWMTTIEFQGNYILFVYATLALFLGLQWGVTTLFIPVNALLTWKRIMAIASFWTLMEWIRLFFLCGFSFNPLGLSLASSMYPAQWASIWGVLGLSFWVMLVNLSVFKAMFTRRTVIGAGLLFCIALGIWRSACCLS